MPSVYTRLSSSTLSAIKTELSANPVINRLTDTQKNAIMNNSAQKIASFRNALEKDDYSFDTTGVADILTISVDYAKFISIVAVSAGTTYNGTLYNTDTIVILQQIGFSPAIATPVLAAGVLTIAHNGQISPTAIVNPNNWDIAFDQVLDPNNMTIALGSGWGAYLVEIYMR